MVGERANEVVVRLQGEGGYLEAGGLVAALLPLSARRPRLVTFDLSGLRSLSLLALGALVRYRRGAVRAGGRVRLTALQPNVREVVEQAGWALLLEEQASEAAAPPGAGA
jgi:anti-anti-sigma factor